MTVTRPPVGGGAWLVRQADRFRRSLRGLLDRLRDDLSQTVARAAADAVREGRPPDGRRPPPRADETAGRGLAASGLAG